MKLQFIWDLNDYNILTNASQTPDRELGDCCAWLNPSTVHISFHNLTHLLGATPPWLAEQSINMWAVALRSRSIEKLHLKIIAGRAVQAAEHKSNGFFLQMCEDEARGTDVLSSGHGQHILTEKKCSTCGGSAVLRRSPEACQDVSITGEAGREGRGEAGGGEPSATKTPGCLVNSAV